MSVGFGKIRANHALSKESFVMCDVDLTVFADSRS